MYYLKVSIEIYIVFIADVGPWELVGKALDGASLKPRKPGKFRGKPGKKGPNHPAFQTTTTTTSMNLPGMIE